jgi:Rrf2 family protein
MLDILQHGGGVPRSLRDIAQSQSLSTQYVANLAAKLKAAGLLNAVSGLYGGYTLSRKPQSISLLEIIEAAEGKMSIVKCVECPKSCKKSKTCKVRTTWDTLNNKVTDAFASTSLLDVAE